ncbi:MAG: aminotransferase, partial [Clostridia bacterium]|nr:aminotransferase [Clostridia bacterium]
NIFDACSEASNPDIVISFSSTSKVSFPGSGVAVMAASPRNLEFMKQQISIQTIGPDKLNQLRHVKTYKNAAGVLKHMKKLADILRPKFEAVLSILDEELSETGVGSWTRPKGGYFIGFDTMDGCAKRVYNLCKEAGVVLTTAGATYPGGIDPKDRNIRLAPSYPPMEELQVAMRVFCVCVKLAAVEKLLEDM